jgi:uncharacterized protein (DUF2147 family)
MKYTSAFLIIFVSLLVFTYDVTAKSKTMDYAKLVGNWIRPDGGYVLAIKAVSKEGKMEAAYFNPNNINVAKASATIESGKINLFVELQDTGYPGSYYTLAYDPDKDRLVGVYHHMVLKQNFDTYFVRQ